jgi:hypothetical protein
MCLLGRPTGESRRPNRRAKFRTVQRKIQNRSEQRTVENRAELGAEETSSAKNLNTTY